MRACSRHWLRTGRISEVLQDHRIEAYGIDSNQMMIHYCTEKGLQAQEADVLAHLERYDNSLGGIFAAHVVEHLPPRELQRFLQLCFDKLQYHKYLVLETPESRHFTCCRRFFTRICPIKDRLIRMRYIPCSQPLGFADIQTEGKAPFLRVISTDSDFKNLS